MADSVRTSVGDLTLDVPIGRAEAQLVPWPSHWWVPRLRAALDRRLADRVVTALASRCVDDPAGSSRRMIPRSALYDIAATGDTAAAQFAVTAWGVGNSGKVGTPRH